MRMSILNTATTEQMGYGIFLFSSILNLQIFTFILQNYGFELYMSPVSFRGSLREASLRKKK